MGIVTVLWEKWVEFRRDFYKITVAAMSSPLMYLIIFGMGIQTTSHGEPYLHFLIPGHGGHGHHDRQLQRHRPEYERAAAL